MIIFLSDLQKEHLSVFQQHSIHVLVDFCKLTIDYFSNGVNEKKYLIAAEKLNVSVTIIQNLIYALAFLIVEGCKHNLSDTNFKSSLAIAGFSHEQQLVLLKLYETNKVEISKGLNLLQERDPNYQDLHWRFEIQVASKHSLDEIVPMVSMDFVLATPKNYGQSDEDIMLSTVKEQKLITPINKITSIQDAKATSQCQHVVNHVLLHSDLPNLVNLTQKLDEALKESKSQHVRKVQRALQ